VLGEGLPASLLLRQLALAPLLRLHALVGRRLQLLELRLVRLQLALQRIHLGALLHRLDARLLLDALVLLDLLGLEAHAFLRGVVEVAQRLLQLRDIRLQRLAV